MITYVLIVSRTFPALHPKAGQSTDFCEKILNGLAYKKPEKWGDCKVHTIRKNYDLWKKRIEKVKAGKAEISIRYWSGVPYRSKQITFCKLTKTNGIGISQIFLSHDLEYGFKARIDTAELFGPTDLELIAHHDGLTATDFLDWFFPYRKINNEFSGAIIHFNGLRY